MDPFLTIFGLTAIVLPSITFTFIYFLRKNRADVDKLRYEKEILELELKRDQLKLLRIAEENKKYDRLIEGEISDLEE